jgi:hypothetical protein
MAFGRLTPCARKVIELALRESLQLGHDYIGTEHVRSGWAGRTRASQADTPQVPGREVEHV